MGAVKGKDTGPELVVRSCVHELGLRFRLHSTRLPGRPDLVLSRHRTVIFVQGCFWHRHDCTKASAPKTNEEFWRRKFARNVKRDRENREALESLGWRVVEIWECETHDRDALRYRLAQLFPVRHDGLTRR